MPSIPFKQFVHKDLLIEGEIKEAGIDGKRLYQTPEGIFPSVTSVVGFKKQQFFSEWRRKNPEESKRVLARGTKFHGIIENYLNNVDLDIDNKFELNLENVSYKYKGARNFSFQNVSLQIKDKQKICIAGFNDAGKSTLIKTIAGLYENYDGIIRLNGISIKEINPYSYRDIIGDNLTLADVFEGTIEENITLGRNGILLKDILKVCEEVGLNQFIAGLEDGLQSQVLPSGSNFPSSAVKKILIARSLVKPPKLLLIDEFFHNVQSSDKIELIERLFNGDYAMFIVSSIPEVMKRSDLIYIMKDGKVLDSGSFEELTQRNVLPLDNQIYS
jgi:ABC-type multidrug transport system fused ATPase/permease subunit